MAWHHGVLAKRSAHPAIGRWNCCQSWRNHINLLVGLSPVVKFHVELFCGHFLGGKWATLIPWSIPQVCLLLLDGVVPINCPRKTWKCCSLEIEWTRWGGCSWYTKSFHQLGNTIINQYMWLTIVRGTQFATADEFWLWNLGMIHQNSTPKVHGDNLRQWSVSWFCKLQISWIEHPSI